MQDANRQVVSVRVKYTHDPESGNWMYEVPALNILGVGCLSRQEAERLAAEAVAFTLEAPDPDPSEEPGEEIDYFQVKIA